jgi:catechol 2,3-dioxygenase-like lactoylglutathione lyase family enzyme
VRGESLKPISATGFAHVQLTVTDIARSRSFCEDVFAFPVAFEVPADADQAIREALGFLYGGVFYQVGSSVFGLRLVAGGPACGAPRHRGQAPHHRHCAFRNGYGSTLLEGRIASTVLVFDATAWRTMLAQRGKTVDVEGHVIDV